MFIIKKMIVILQETRYEAEAVAWPENPVHVSPCLCSRWPTKRLPKDHTLMVMEGEYCCAEGERVWGERQIKHSVNVGKHFTLAKVRIRVRQLYMGNIIETAK